MIDGKLQLELVPYPSKTFAPGSYDKGYLDGRMKLLLGVVAAYPRSHVLFCARAFERVLSRDALGSLETFHLGKKDDTPTKNAFRFRTVDVGPGIRAAITPSFASKGLNGVLVAQYGAECAKRLNGAFGRPTE